MNEDAMKSEDSITFAQLIVHDNGLRRHSSLQIGCMSIRRDSYQMADRATMRSQWGRSAIFDKYCLMPVVGCDKFSLYTS